MNNRHIVLAQKSQEKQDKTFGMRLKSVQLFSWILILAFLLALVFPPVKTCFFFIHLEWKKR